jgi:hypothetical protein
VASERATKSVARLFILLYICGVGGLVFLGLMQTTTELRLSPTLVEGWKCLMLRGYTGQQPMATLPLCSYGTEDAEFDVAFESATATFDQCVRLLRARGPAADPRWVSCSCDLGVQRDSSQADCYACGDALQEYGWCNTGPTSPTSISNATLAALLNSTAANNSSGSAVPTTAAQQSCLYSLSVNIGGMPDLDFRDLHEDATGVAAFYSATPLTLSWCDGQHDRSLASQRSQFASSFRPQNLSYGGLFCRVAPGPAGTTTCAPQPPIPALPRTSQPSWPAPPTTGGCAPSSPTRAPTCVSARRPAPSTTSSPWVRGTFAPPAPTCGP